MANKHTYQDGREGLDAHWRELLDGIVGFVLNVRDEGLDRMRGEGLVAAFREILETEQHLEASSLLLYLHEHGLSDDTSDAIMAGEHRCRSDAYERLAKMLCLRDGVRE